MNSLTSMLEVKMNEWAESIAHKYRIKKGTFRITIKESEVKPKQSTRYGYVIQDGTYHEWRSEGNTVERIKKTYIVTPQDLVNSHNQLLATVHNGPVVLITLYVPLVENKDNDLTKQLIETIKQMKKTCRRLFKYLSDIRIHNDEELFNPTIVGDFVHEYLEIDKKTRKFHKRGYDYLVKNDHHRNEFSIEIEKKITFTHKETGVSYSVVDYNNQKTEWELEQEVWEVCANLVNEKESNIIQSSSTSLVQFGHFNTLIHPVWD